MLTKSTELVQFRVPAGNRSKTFMLKISKLTDYGLLATVYLARHRGRWSPRARSPSFYHLPLPMITKVLKALSAGG